MKTKLTLFVTVLAAALFLGGCESTNGTNEPADEEKPTVDPLKNGLVAYYPFNGNAKDESGNGHDGDVKGATLSADRHGGASSAYSFDGVDDFIDLPVIDFNALNSFTVSLWFKPNDTVLQRQRLIDIKATREKGRAGGIAYNDLKGGAVSYGPHGQTAYGKKQLDSGKYNPMPQFRLYEVSIYVDGKPDYSGEIIDLIVPAARVRIGARMDTDKKFRKTNGSIDDVRIYNRALSTAEVKALYDLEKPKGK